MDLPRLSLRERDRRWDETRRAMRAIGLDCLVLTGMPLHWDFCVANARYLSPIGGNAEFNILVFPLDDEPTSFVFSPVFVDYWRSAQNWVSDVRSRKSSLAETVAGRLKELGLDAGRIGMDGLAGPLDPDGWVPHSMYVRLQELIPSAELINVDDMLEKARAVKSEEEIEILGRAARLGDLMLATCRDKARPGVKECEIYGAMMEVMLANGGEEPTLFLWTCDRSPRPHPFRVPTQRRVEPGDMIICEIHPKYGGYFTHVERTFCIGEPGAKYLEIYDGCLAAYESGMRMFGPKQKMSTAMDAVKATIESRGLGICEAGIHGHGLGSLEYPRYRHHAIGADQGAIAAMGDEFRENMVFAFNIDLFDPRWRDGETGCVFAETVLITDSGARRLHTYPTEFQVLPT